MGKKIDKEYVSFETAQLLGSVGFNWGCSRNSIFYPEDGFEDCSTGVYAPRLDVAQRWLREVKKIDVLIEKRFCAYVYSLGNISNEYENVIIPEIPEMSTGFDTYEQALEAGIKKAVKHLLKIRSEFSEIKKMLLQNNFTTPEQSKRLLELGLPADTADCYFHENKRKELSRIFHCGDKTYSEQLNTAFTYEIDPNMLPCWSVGRLIEIYLLCSTSLKPNDEHITISRFGNQMFGFMNSIYQMVTEQLLLNHMDLTKLK